MAGIRLPPDDSDVSQAARQVSAVDLISDDDRSVAADSWSIKSDYGSTLDDEQRHADAAEALSAATYRAASDYRKKFSLAFTWDLFYENLMFLVENSDFGNDEISISYWSSSDKEEPDAEAVSSMLGFQSYWDAAYADELTNFREHGHAGEITQIVCLEDSLKKTCLAGVLDVGTGNGLLLQELAKQGFSDLTGTDYSEGAIDLARSLADRDGFSNIKFLVDDVLDTKLDRKFQLVTDKGTLDAIGLHPDGPVKRMMYWDSISGLVASGGLLVITSCNSTKDELIQEVETFNQRRTGTPQEPDTAAHQNATRDITFQYVDHIRTYPTFMFGGAVGSRVATVAFLRK
ncbi:UNVERIFIED_CONTAM: EEF1A lysine methyltransferase 2 [Sesamum angustifolium]|uniref:Protein-lysine N-methyltransferase Sangu_1227600 n=1 Tax=Sesamum angustifolium TaxID=2727405 RepID=A0AAW2NJ00_9LAMI